MKSILLALIFLVGMNLSMGLIPQPATFRVEAWSDEEPNFHEVVCDAEFLPQVHILMVSVRSLGVKGMRISTQSGGLHFSKAPMEGESYEIKASKGGLKITAGNSAGMARATATLLQLAEVENSRVAWQKYHISDQADHPFRCVMVDLGRNPHSPKTLRHLIDTLWYFKVNYLQLHLTDDQLCSWPSRAFPKLANPASGWTWDDYVALEKYSQARGVTLIPEIDVPGHSTLLRKFYPEVFGKTPTELASLPSAREGVEKLIEETLSVFQRTPYFHMGGDEAYGVDHQVQRDFINHINRFVKSKGKQLIVWEGPPAGKGEGRVVKDVIHMAWRSLEFPAQQMLEQGHQVINASWDPLYIVDHYPRTMFTAVDLERCYRWNPRKFQHINPSFQTFGKPHLTKEVKGILGFCLPWWEGRQENLLPLCVPRIAAVSAGAWNREDENQFSSFQDRYPKSLIRLETLSGFELPKLPVAPPASQEKNLAYLAEVTPSAGANQPHFGPQRLTNGITDRFDHFLGFPTKPQPMEITVKLRKVGVASRVVIHERALRGSYEVYQLLVSEDGKDFRPIGNSKKGTRGDKSYVEHKFTPQKIHSLKVITEGCHGLVFPSFSRLSEIEVFAE